MKQLLFLLLFPCLAMAQYPANGNQKISLGEQTTADGLVFRGVANDTNVITPFSDTSAYIILDTVNSKFYHYNRTTTFWALAGGGGDSGGVTSFSAGTTGLTPSTATTGAVTLGGTLAVANGGTGSSTQNFVDLTTTQSSIAGAKTFTSAVTGARFDPTSSSATGTGMYLPASNKLGFSTNGTNKMTLDSTGQLLIGTSTSSNFILDIFKATTNTTAYARIKNNRNRNAAFLIETNLGSYYFGVGIGADVNQFQIYDGNAGETRLLINSIGNVGIGTTSPQSGYRLHVVDSVYVGGNVSASAYTTRSDYDLKDEIQNISYGINEVMQMQPVKYTYKSNGSSQLGFIAQDLGVITPEVVSFEDKMSVYYNALIPILTKAIQEQQALIKALEQRLLILENK